MKATGYMTVGEEGPKKGVRYSGGPMLPIEAEVARGLRFTHLMVLVLQRQADETVSMIEALEKLLTAKGITSDAEWADAMTVPPFAER